MRHDTRESIKGYAEDMPHAKRSFLWPCCLILLLAGCATPRYQSEIRYEAPSDALGQACIETCTGKLAACKSRCAAEYQTCLQDLEPSIESHYLEALKNHERDLERYRGDLEHYQLQLWLGWHRDPWWFGHGWSRPWWPSPMLIGKPPTMPTRDAVRDQLRQQRCERDCGCQPEYDACFLSCGGQRLEIRRCIANCPREH